MKSENVLGNKGSFPIRIDFVNICYKDLQKLVKTELKNTVIQYQF